MMDMIRRQIMKRLQDKKENFSKWQSNICPRILQKLELEKKRCRAQ